MVESAQNKFHCRNLPATLAIFLALALVLEANCAHAKPISANKTPDETDPFPDMAAAEQSPEMENTVDELSDEGHDAKLQMMSAEELKETTSKQESNQDKAEEAIDSPKQLSPLVTKVNVSLDLEDYRKYLKYREQQRLLDQDKEKPTEMPAVTIQPEKSIEKEEAEPAVSTLHNNEETTHLAPVIEDEIVTSGDTPLQNEQPQGIPNNDKPAPFSLLPDIPSEQSNGAGTAEVNLYAQPVTNPPVEPETNEQTSRRSSKANLVALIAFLLVILPGIAIVGLLFFKKCRKRRQKKTGTTTSALASSTSDLKSEANVESAKQSTQVKDSNSNNASGDSSTDNEKVLSSSFEVNASTVSQNEKRKNKRKKGKKKNKSKSKKRQASKSGKEKRKKREDNQQTNFIEGI